MVSDSPSTVFLGVRFVLIGFDPTGELKVRSRLVGGGGVDVGEYGQNCTHVIVDQIVYDDPVCIAARNDGKILVTGLWVDRSLVIGRPLDATSVMYRPLRDLNGIPGAKSLIICLTGYRKQDREDIMIMAGLIGAQFLKPLVASKVTHLICYKFEGEKYELAKKTKRIKLVNHRWLEDCLREWKLLTEDNYDKSGYELDVMEAEVKDSEEEPEDALPDLAGGRNMKMSPCISSLGLQSAVETPRAESDVPVLLPKYSIEENHSKAGTFRDMPETPSKRNTSNQASGSDSTDNLVRCVCKESVTSADALSPHKKSPTVENTPMCSSNPAEISSRSGVKFNAICYSRRKHRKPWVTRSLGNLDDFLEPSFVASRATKVVDSSCLSENVVPSTFSSHHEGPTEISKSHNEESFHGGVLPQKRSAAGTVVRFKSQKIGNNNKANVKSNRLLTCKDSQQKDEAVTYSSTPKLSSLSEKAMVFYSRRSAFKDDSASCSTRDEMKVVEMSKDSLEASPLTASVEATIGTEMGTDSGSVSAKTNDTTDIEKHKLDEELKKDELGEPPGGNSVSKSAASPRNVNKNSEKINWKSALQTKTLNNAAEGAVWFILSGNRLQRKEFQRVIRRLKGRCFRDSHQWSYQATHFITPEPHRTEKFFAACAAGRWILKSDYLTACNQAGSFLPEEPYEWYSKRLSEDGAVNLEAPRKWRLLSEKTGHGAFYGMQIVVYGDCIMPPLDTLKRAVKAGDGAIVATSPPYTRFLNSGVDFAVISPGTPQADIWVQEFLKHEIPCVLADYMVEYVCKPGYSLERHVLYNTHAWASTSRSNLQSKAETSSSIQWQRN